MGDTGDNMTAWTWDECEIVFSAWECLFWHMNVYLTNE